MGQQNDYVVKINGDTVRGEIEIEKNAVKIQGDGTHTIRPADIKFISSKKYKGNTVLALNLLLYTTVFDELEMGLMKTKSTDTVLVLNEIYSTPKINLYFAKDKKLVPYYFYKTPQDSLPIQLVVHYHLSGGLGNYANDPQRYSNERSKVTIIEDKGFVNQLYAIMGDCTKISAVDWELLAYSEYSLRKVIKTFNKCK